MSEHELGTARANEGSKKPLQPGLGKTPVSYTHLDVYKRQLLYGEMI